MASIALGPLGIPQQLSGLWPHVRLVATMPLGGRLEGTGFIRADRPHLVITAAHVIRQASRIVAQVCCDGFDQRVVDAVSAAWGAAECPFLGVVRLPIASRLIEALEPLRCDLAGEATLYGYPLSTRTIAVRDALRDAPISFEIADCWLHWPGGGEEGMSGGAVVQAGASLGVYMGRGYEEADPTDGAAVRWTDESERALDRLATEAESVLHRR